MARVFIGVAWPYASGGLHLGHIAGCYLAADIFARYHRMMGDEVLMVSGSDQHGTPITVVAEKEGTTPAEVAKKYHNLNKDLLARLNITFDIFSETTTENHKKTVQEIFLTLLKKGYIYRGRMRAPFCNKCNRFLPDRYVEGTCPFCKFKSARGDQCDHCGKLMDVEEILELRCRLCGHKPVFKDTEHFFLKLTALQPALSEYIGDKSYWRPNVLNFTQNWLKDLKDRPITRDLEWGVEIPLEGYEQKRIYVWFDAVIGYLSASKEWSLKTGKNWEQYWLDKSTRHYYFVGKDNIPFHTIIWPAMLIAYGGLNLPFDIPANEFLLLRGEQFSKSRGVAVWLQDCLSNYSADEIRYYIAATMPERHDTDFSWEAFKTRINDLADTIGNFAHRVLTFAYKQFKSCPPLRAEKLSQLDKDAIANIDAIYESVTRSLEKCEFKNALEAVVSLAVYGNKYIQQNAPWDTIKKDLAAAETTIHICLRYLKALALLLAPFLPESCEKIWRFIGYGNSVHTHKLWEAKEDIEAGRTLPKPEVLFRKL